MDVSNANAKWKSDIERNRESNVGTISTTGLAGGLLKPYKGFSPAQESKDSSAGMTTRQISETMEDIYGFETSEGFISDVTDKILLQIEDWKNCPMDEMYPVLYIDAIHYSVHDNGVIRKLAAYVILGINAEGRRQKMRKKRWTLWNMLQRNGHRTIRIP